MKNFRTFTVLAVMALICSGMFNACKKDNVAKTKLQEEKLVNNEKDNKFDYEYTLELSKEVGVDILQLAEESFLDEYYVSFLHFVTPLEKKIETGELSRELMSEFYEDAYKADLNGNKDEQIKVIAALHNLSLEYPASETVFCEMSMMYEVMYDQIIAKYPSFEKLDLEKQQIVLAEAFLIKEYNQLGHSIYQKTPEQDAAFRRAVLVAGLKLGGKLMLCGTTIEIPLLCAICVAVAYSDYVDEVDAARRRIYGNS